MTQIMSIDDLKAKRGEKVYFIRHMNFTAYARGKDGDRITESTARMFPWHVTNVLYERLPKDAHDPLPGYPINRAVCTDDYREGHRGFTLIVWLDQYLAVNNRSEMSGIFSTHDSAMAHMALIKLVSENYKDVNMTVGSDFTNNWCQIGKLSTLSDYADFSAELSLPKRVTS